MYVLKRSGSKQRVYFDKINIRNEQMARGLDIDPTPVTQKVIQGLKSGIKTQELDLLSAETALYMSVFAPEYEEMAKNILISNMHKSTQKSFIDVTEELSEILDDDYLAFVREHGAELDGMIVHGRDYAATAFGFKTLERSYLLKNSDQKIVERPQHMWLRVATFIRMPDIEAIKQVYDMMSTKKFTHASPTLFNAGTKYPQLSSCFLIGMNDDLSNMFDTLKGCAQISKFSGGIGINISNIRSLGAKIHSVNGIATGIVPFMKVWNEMARYVNQGGKRKGSVAVYLEPHHPDLFDFLNIRKTTTTEGRRCLDLHNALWIPDIFFERLEQTATNPDVLWSFFDPTELIREDGKGLHDLYGKEYEELYIRGERQGLFRTQKKITEVWRAICSAISETSEPYIHFKDAINEKNNQRNLGIIRGSNLCSEITEYSSADEWAVCNLASISLPAFVKNGRFDYTELYETARVVTYNMNQVIDKNFYPTEQTRRSNLLHRPTGIGVQGLADVFQMLGFAWESDEAGEVNRQIAEVIYYACVEMSCELAERDGVYASYEGSPMSEGMFQFDLWKVVPSGVGGLCDWDGLRSRVKKHGLRNSLLTTQMPTASTSQIMGNNESIEPYTSNIYVRRVLAGEFPVINRHLYRRLKELGLWNRDLVQKILRNGGSVADIEDIPQDVRNLFKTPWEMPTKVLVDRMIERAPYVCQNQSFNLFIDVPTVRKLSSIYMYEYRNGSKIGSYYVRRRPATKPIQFTLDVELEGVESDDWTSDNESAADDVEPVEDEYCTMQEGCVMCSG